MKFDYDLDFKNVDFRAHPELYRIGKGEQGVLLVEPYKGEILPHWRFKTPAVAQVSADKIYQLYEAYKAANDFVGMDMGRKFLQMGWTRSMRYANHRTGKKYVGAVPPERKGQSGAWGREVAPAEPDEEKLESAKIFREKLDLVRADPVYAKRVERHREMFDPSAKQRSKASALRATVKGKKLSAARES